MKRLVLVLIVISVTAIAPSRSGKGKFGGTFIGVMVAEDSILIGSDSRSTFVDDSNQPVGYVDRMPKIYVKHGAALAVAGLTSVEEATPPLLNVRPTGSQV